MKITVEADANATTEQCWAAAVTPSAIHVWNTARPDWQCPHTEVDLKVGGRMEAKDGSM